MAQIEASDVTVDVPGRRLLDGLDLTVGAGEVVAVVGPSGSGKTTLLNCLAGLVVPQRGCVRVAGADLTRMSVAQRAAHRLSRIGLVFQFGELLPELSAGENVALPLLLSGAENAAGRARLALAGVGLADRYDQSPSQLSGGETQRVGLARALVHGPSVIVADEPTGALDATNAEVVADLLCAAARDRQAAVVMATHDAQVAGRADRVLRLVEGRVQDAAAEVP